MYYNMKKKGGKSKEPGKTTGFLQEIRGSMLFKQCDNQQHMPQRVAKYTVANASTHIQHLLTHMMDEIFL